MLHVRRPQRHEHPEAEDQPGSGRFTTGASFDASTTVDDTDAVVVKLSPAQRGRGGRLGWSDRWRDGDHRAGLTQVEQEGQGTEGGHQEEGAFKEGQRKQV